MAREHLNDDAPELDEAFFKRARPAREVMSEAAQANFKPGRGRPKSAAPKKLVSLRLSPSHLEQFKSEGAGWQGRIDAALRHGDLHPAMAELLVVQEREIVSLRQQEAQMSSGALSTRARGTGGEWVDTTQDRLAEIRRRIAQLEEIGRRYQPVVRRA